MRGALTRPLIAAVAVATAAATLGCGAGAGPTPSGTRLLVTKDFGATVLAQDEAAKASGQDTVMRLLQRSVKEVETAFGGGFVQSIDGVSGSNEGGRRRDWFFFVNGYISDKGAAAVKVHDGDRIWWDNHDWTYNDHIPAVVGSFPEPFVHGFGGNRHPVRLECGTTSVLCTDVQKRLTDLGVLAAIGEVGRSYTKQTLRLLVGPWQKIGSDAFARTIGRGPRESGVYVRFSADGRRLTTLDERGRAVRTLGPGTGLIAATVPPGEEMVQSGQVRKDPIWVVTGTDQAGVEAAAQAFDEGALAGRFAVAVVGGKPVALPERPR